MKLDSLCCKKNYTEYMHAQLKKSSDYEWIKAWGMGVGFLNSCSVST